MKQICAVGVLGLLALFMVNVQVDGQQPKPPGEKPLDTKHPDTKKPDTKHPDTKHPDTKKPDTKQPDTKHPDTKKPDTKHPDAKHPDTKKPDTKHPETKIPNPTTPVPVIQSKSVNPGGVTTAPGGAPLAHVHLHNALFELRAAEAEINAIPKSPVLSARKNSAKKAIKTAIGQIDLILTYNNDNIKGVAAPGDRGLSKQYTVFPHLNAAAAEMVNAQASLLKDSNPYAGHKQKTLDAMAIAQKEIQALIAAASQGF